ncbi:MAG: hypothetical protein H6566_27820 [Lewinellaceae bacterium]|nr:hypothetical protein [Lewinellaceae bacterium]
MSFQSSPLHTIDDVLRELDAIIARSLERNDAAGIFAYVYRRTTAQVKEGILEKCFEDNERMERLDVVFARRYIEAYRQWQSGQAPPDSWQLAFSACQKPLTIFQHVLLGMNAHINFDLGIAAAEVAPEASIESLRNDFLAINGLLADIVDELQSRLSRVSPLFFVIDWLGGRRDEAVINLNIQKARGLAWELACRLAQASTGAEREEYIRAANALTLQLGRLIERPPGRLLPNALRFVRWWEVKDIRQVLEKLQA